MTLIVGGAYQGKTEFAAGLLCIPCEQILNGETCDIEEIFSASAVRHFEALVKRVLEEGEPRNLARELCAKNPDVIVLVNEIGSGIIPIDKLERDWREEVGRESCILAEFADTVIRMNCGIPTTIKGTVI
ncbi:MAG: bifunctional adenosylcobinamide kinase/adenosylcobinamide-phosphate guanylyltransferase [Oscillospiraceae bacterium]